MSEENQENEATPEQNTPTSGDAPAPAPANPGPPPVTATGEIDGGMTDKTWAMIGHLSGALWVLGLPGIVGALIVWLVKKDTMPFVDQEGKESVNFQISNLIYMVGAVAIAFITCGVGFFAPFLVGLFSVIFSIIAGVKANEGIGYRYPLNIRFIK